MSFDMDWNKAQKDLSEIKKKKMSLIEQAVERAVERGARKVEAQIVQNIKSQGITDTGELINSIDIRKKSGSGSKVIYEVYTDSEHAGSVEFGSRPHAVSARHLKAWAKRKLGDENLAYPIALKIKRRGTKANPFFRKAYYQKRKEVQDDVKKAIRDAIRE